MDISYKLRTSTLYSPIKHYFMGVNKMEKEKIKFKDLSGWLKLSIIMGWIVAAQLLLAFLYGFFIGMGF